MFPIPLRQSTAKLVTFGPLVDVTDKITPETGVTLGAADAAVIQKNQAGSQVSIVAATWAHIGQGVYNLTLDATHTDTLGPLMVLIRDDSVFDGPVRQDYVVLAANVYDALIPATDKLQVDAVELNSDATAGANLAIAAAGMKSFTVQSSSTATVIKTNLSETDDDFWNGKMLTFTTGALAGQTTRVSDYNGTTKDLTVDTLTGSPSNGDIAILY